MYYVQYNCIIEKIFNFTNNNFLCVHTCCVMFSKRENILSSLRNSFDIIPRKDLHKQVASCSWNYTMQCAEEIIAEIAPFHSSLCDCVVGIFEIILSLFLAGWDYF